MFNKNFFKDWRKVMNEKEKEKIRDLSKCDFTEINTYYKKVCFLLLALPACLRLCTYVLPHALTDGVGRIFSLTPMLRPGIELRLAQLHLFEGL